MFNIDSSSAFQGDVQNFFYFELHAQEMVVRECRTNGRRQTFGWMPEVWRTGVRLTGPCE